MRDMNNMVGPFDGRAVETSWTFGIWATVIVFGALVAAVFITKLLELFLGFGGTCFAWGIVAGCFIGYFAEDAGLVGRKKRKKNRYPDPGITEK